MSERSSHAGFAGEREIWGPRRLQPIGAIRNVFGFIVPESVPYTDCFEVEHWRRACDQLRPGDIIQCMTADRRTQFEVFIIDANAQAEPVRLDLCFRAIYPPDLKVPPPIVEAQRWKLKQRQTDGLYFIYDAVKDEVIADAQRREQGLQTIALLEKQARENVAANAMAKVPDTIDPERRGEPENRADFTPPDGWTVGEPAPVVTP